jgi:hypothetical protein
MEFEMARELIKPKANLIAALADNMNDQMWASDMAAQAALNLSR